MKTNFRLGYYISLAITTICMSVIISLVVVLTMGALAGPFSRLWLRSSLYAFLVGYPTAIIVTPLANKVMSHFMKTSE